MHIALIRLNSHGFKLMIINGALCVPNDYCDSSIYFTIAIDSYFYPNWLELSSTSGCLEFN